MPRKKMNAAAARSETINVRVTPVLSEDIRAECLRLDLPVSHFGRKSFEFFLSHLRQKSSLYDESSQKLK
ncbi:hypothetical protein EB118_11285 [bacterium]|nr:hypothetical protein [bacterium]